MNHYKLVNGKPVATDDVMECERQWENHEWIIKQETVDGVWISTVFLGLNHNFSGSDEVIIWETMIQRNGEWLDYQTRCSGNIENARKMHERAVEYVKGGMKE